MEALRDITLYNADCMGVMAGMADKSVDFTLTDIPYDGVNAHKSNGLRSWDKGVSDVITFDLGAFCSEVSRVCRGSVCIWCGFNQVSALYNYFFGHGYTCRLLVWEKTNPSPMNGGYVYLCGVECAVWARPSGATFNAHCKNTVFRYPIQRGTIHNTEKSHALLGDILGDNTSVGDLVFDPCFGSGSCAVMCHRLGRRFVGCELDATNYANAKKRLEELQLQTKLF